MKLVWNFSLAAVAVLVAGSLSAQTAFNLGFSGPQSFKGAGGTAWTGDYQATLTSDGGGTGAQGWSVSMSADNASITAVTTNGTDVDALFSGGFKKSELTTKGSGDCAGRNGAVSAVVLSFTEPITLPVPPSSSVIALLTAGGEVPAGGGTATLRYVDNCQGAGQPVQNNITQDGATVSPTLGSLAIELQTPPPSCCDAQANVGFSSTSQSSTTAYDGIVDDGAEDCSGGGGVIEVPVARGATGTTKVFTNISSNGAGDGVQGWSLSIRADGDIVTPVAVTTAGTVVDALFDGGFRKTEAIDPTKNDNKNGAVSAIVLSFTNPVTLPPTGTATVLEFDVSANAAQGDTPIVGTLSFEDGLRGSGQPVQNALTIGGATVPACNFGTASVTISFELQDTPAANEFLRGNANNDGKVDIADPIWIINEKFRGGPATACQAAADANGDGAVGDAADVVFLINYQFAGGSAPPAPFPACDSAPVEQCAESQAVCAP